MKIRTATLKDKKEISELYYQLYPEKKKKIIPIKKFDAKNFLLVAEEGKEIIGFIWGNFISYGIDKFGYIEELFVKEKFRGKGIGTALVKTIIKKFKKLKAAALFVTTDRETAKFYKKLGFKISRPWLCLDLTKQKNKEN